MPFEPERILAVLERHGVRYVVIGGFGAWLHGAAHVTFDIDVTPESSRDNLDRLSTALDDLAARIRTDAVEGGLSFSHSGESLGHARVWNLTTDYGDLDLAFEPAGTNGYSDLVDDALQVEILGVSTVIASLRDIVRSKEAADRPKDRLALPTLRRLLEAQEDDLRD
jgi:hypothetical protein